MRPESCWRNRSTGGARGWAIYPQPRRRTLHRGSNENQRSNPSDSHSDKPQLLPGLLQERGPGSHAGVCCGPRSRSNCFFTPGTCTNQIQAAFRGPQLEWRLIPGLTTSPHRGGLCQPAHSVTDSPLRSLGITVPGNKGAHSASDAGDAARRIRGTIISRERPWEVKPDLNVYGDQRRLRRRSRLLL